METQFSRTEGLLGEKAVKHLQNCHVAVFGVGGVGGFTVEALARSGVGKIDIIDKNNQLPCYIQIKHTLQTPQYFVIREQSTVPNEEFCIIWDKQKKCEKNIVTVGSAVIMDKQLFYKLIEPYARKQ